jgi:hypothetical protein
MIRAIRQHESVQQMLIRYSLVRHLHLVRRCGKRRGEAMPSQSGHTAFIVSGNHSGAQRQDPRSLMGRDSLQIHAGTRLRRGSLVMSMEIRTNLCSQGSVSTGRLILNVSSIQSWTVPLVKITVKCILNRMARVYEHSSIILQSTRLSRLSPPTTPLRAIPVTIILNVRHKLKQLYPQCGMILRSINRGPCRGMSATIRLG